VQRRERRFLRQFFLVMALVAVVFAVLLIARLLLG
jgi:predicted nucleic acid-binding Zn ribbon protein